MIKFLKSECLKMKNSYIQYLILTFSIIEFLTIPPYLFFVKNTYTLDGMIYFPMLGYTILLSIVSILTFEQECLANKFQNIRSGDKGEKLWASKILSVDILLLLPSLCMWSFIGLILKESSTYAFIGLMVWLMTIFLYHFHMVLGFFISKGSNVIVAFVECLFIIFATNKAFLGVYWLPIILPVNAIIEMKHDGNMLNIISLIIWITLLYFLNILALKFKKNSHYFE